MTGRHSHALHHVEMLEQEILIATTLTTRRSGGGEKNIVTCAQTRAGTLNTAAPTRARSLACTQSTLVTFFPIHPGQNVSPSVGVFTFWLTESDQLVPIWPSPS